MMGLSDFVGSVRLKTSLKPLTRSCMRDVEVLITSEVGQKILVFVRK